MALDHIQLKRLLEDVANGDKASFTVLFDGYKQKVYSYSLRITQEVFLAEEITQEIFLKIWTSRVSLTTIENFDAWIGTITRNRCFDHLKKKALDQKLVSNVAALPVPENENVSQHLFYREQLQQIDHAISQLPPKQQLIFRLKKEKGLDTEEIAQQLNISPRTVKAQMVTALRKLRRYLHISPTQIILLFIFLR